MQIHLDNVDVYSWTASSQRLQKVDAKGVQSRPLWATAPHWTYDVDLVFDPTRTPPLDCLTVLKHPVQRPLKMHLTAESVAFYNNKLLRIIAI